MAVQIAFVFQSPDRTDYLNQRLAGLIGKGIYSGAELTPTGSGLTATRAPFFALGRDGITIWDTEVGTFTYTSGVENYHVLLAKYNPLGTPSTPVVQELILSASEYNTHVDKPYLIVVGKVTPAGGVLLNSEIDYSLRDEVGPFGRAQLRGVVDNVGELPTGDPNWNRSGDLYVCNDDPAPGGGGLYMWEDGTGWRLVAAKGAATLDGAYDNNGAGGPPGYGRWIEVDSQAVELMQDTGSQRQNDVGNAALRIRKTGSTIAGDVGTDVVFAEDKDVGGLLIRSLFTSGSYIQADEPVNVSGNTLTGTRGAANWNHSSIYKIPLLVELTDSAISNDGLFIALPNGSNTCVIRTLDASTPTLSTETGTTLKANFYSIRYSIGAAGVSRLTEYETGSEFVGSTEFYGGASGSGSGKIVYYDPDSLSYVWKYKMAQAGSSGHTVAYMTDGGAWVFRPKSGSEDWHTLDTQTGHGSFAAIRAEHTANGHAIRAVSATGIGLYVDSNGHNAIEGYGELHGMYMRTYAATTNYAAVRAVANDGARGVYASTTGTAEAVYGYCTGAGGKGVYGNLANAGDTTGYGVYGYHAGNGTGVYGYANGSGSTAKGVAGTAFYGYGVYGYSENGHGVHGVSDEQDGIGVYGLHESYGGDPDTSAGVQGHATSDIDTAGVWASNQWGSIGLALRVSGRSEFKGWGRLQDNAAFSAEKPSADSDFHQALRTRDENSNTGYILDYHGRPCRGNHLTDDFLYTSWHSISSVPDKWVALCDEINGSDVDTTISDFTGGALRLHIGSSPSSYAYIVGRKAWTAYRSDSGGTTRLRFFWRVLLTGGPTELFVGMVNHGSGWPFATAWFGVGTGLSFPSYTDGWNFRYYNSSTGNDNKDQIQFDDWVSWNWYNIEVHVLNSTQCKIMINDGWEQTFTLAGGDTFGSGTWAPTFWVNAPVTADDYYCDFVDVWHDQAFKYDNGYATPSAP
ncbi:MAG: hypothetical protein GWN58_33965 [Anaerolineae bacterium]|nr:hypothetical protein [Thermoplasmata archaeon]NIV34286.1 hypothetical protein [Anaerolineae bacterium]NIY06135.1 hypothetical protein [Thermoplasmata archaeon]